MRWIISSHSLLYCLGLIVGLWNTLDSCLCRCLSPGACTCLNIPAPRAAGGAFSVPTSVPAYVFTRDGALDVACSLFSPVPTCGLGPGPCTYQRRGPWCRLLSVLACAHLWSGLCTYLTRGPWYRLLSVLACAHLWLGPCTYLGHGPWGRLRSVLACTRAQVIRTGASFTWHANNGNHVTAQYRSAYPRWNAPLFGANFSRLVYFCIIGHKLR